MKEIKGQRQHQYSVFLYGILALSFCLEACASPTARQILEEKQSRNRARAAAYAADGFTMDHRSPEPRPYRAWEFYFKHCSLVSRNPYPSKAEHSCTDPY